VHRAYTLELLVRGHPFTCNTYINMMAGALMGACDLCCGTAVHRVPTAGSAARPAGRTSALCGPSLRCTSRGLHSAFRAGVQPVRQARNAHRTAALPVSAELSYIMVRAVASSCCMHHLCNLQAV